MMFNAIDFKIYYLSQETNVTKSAWKILLLHMRLRYHSLSPRMARLDKLFCISRKVL